MQHILSTMKQKVSLTINRKTTPTCHLQNYQITRKFFSNSSSMAMPKMDISNKLTIQRQDDRIINRFRPALSLASKTSKIMTKKTVHTLNGKSVRFADQMFVLEDNTVCWKFICSIKFSLNMRNIFIKSFKALKTAVTHEEAN